MQSVNRLHICSPAMISVDVLGHLICIPTTKNSGLLLDGFPACNRSWSGVGLCMCRKWLIWLPDQVSTLILLLSRHAPLTTAGYLSLRIQCGVGVDLSFLLLL
jgi:hypothetical protein